MSRGLTIAALLTAASALGGCVSEPRLASTFSIRTDLTVEQALYSKQNLDVLEPMIVQRLEEIEVAEIYRATVIDMRYEPRVPYQALAQTIVMQISEIDLGEEIENPEAWMHVTFSIRRLNSDPNLEPDEDELTVWRAFVKRLEPEMGEIRQILAQTLTGGHPWVAQIVRKGKPQLDATPGSTSPPPEDGGFWNLGGDQKSRPPQE